MDIRISIPVHLQGATELLPGALRIPQHLHRLQALLPSQPGNGESMKIPGFTPKQYTITNEYRILSESNSESR